MKEIVQLSLFLSLEHLCIRFEIGPGKFAEILLPAYYVEDKAEEIKQLRAAAAEKGEK